ncbi:MAG: YARHG domain-containing protein, partial [Roseburia hominis]|nr:YARHG domain-containing protein [Roseburia hominis]
LRLARNEIYARHGYTFQDEELRAYFEAKPWYEATVTDVQDTDLNEYEIANRDLIKQVEDSRK